MERKINVIVPFEPKKRYLMNQDARSILLFAKKILDKYSALGMYGFDEAAMVFLEQLEGVERKKEKQGRDIKKQIEFTVRLMLLHQNRNHLAQDIIQDNMAFQKHITNHVLVNLNRLLTVDKRVYSELSQISHNNIKLKEAYDKIVKLENYEKKLVFQVQNQQTVKPKTMQRSFYVMFQQMMQLTQKRISSQIFKETIERKQFKSNLNKLLELQTLRSDVQRHEFLHVMKHGTLEERREAMELLKDAVMEVNQTLVQKESHHEREILDRERVLEIADGQPVSMPAKGRMKRLIQEVVSESVFHTEVNKNQTEQHVWYDGRSFHSMKITKEPAAFYRELEKGIEQKKTLTFQETVKQNRWNQWNQNFQTYSRNQTSQNEQINLQEASRILARREISQREEKSRFVIQQNKQEKELSEIKQMLKMQQTIQTDDRKVFEEIKTKLKKQDQIVTKLVKEQEFIRQQGSPTNISGAINRQLKSELHLDKMRYGMD